LAEFVPPAGRRLLVVPRYGAEQEMLLIEVIFRHVLLVEDVVILYAGRDRVILVFDANSERVGLGMTTEIAAEELVVKPVLRIHRVGIVDSEKAAAVVNEIPDGLLLRVGHPRRLRLAVTLGPVAA